MIISFDAAVAPGRGDAKQTKFGLQVLLEKNFHRPWENA